MTKTIKKGLRRTKGREKPAAKSSARSGRRSPDEGKDLVIVESPAKARTINRYLGSGYTVKASMGHVRDLPKSSMGVDIEHGFRPTYEPLIGRAKILAELKRYAKKASHVFLATDLDREGEAIAWHLAESLGVAAKKIRRVIFNEITGDAIREAFADPREIDMNKVNARQVRRVLDRIVGYQISPLLWRKVAAGLSAGRVQSVAVRLIVDREREIDAFEPVEYWRVKGIFTPNLRGAGKLGREWKAFLAARDEDDRGPTLAAQQEFLTARDTFRAELMKFNGEKFQGESEEQTLEIAKAIGLTIENVERSEDPKGKGAGRHRVTVTVSIAKDAGPFIVRKLTHRTVRSRPLAPFTTVTMQQRASVQLRLSASRTMRTAQQLYEGIDTPGEGSVGLITYMRTDSTRVSEEALKQVRSLVSEIFGENYLPEKPNRYAVGARAQGAHEAIRPTDVRRRPEDIRTSLDKTQFRLYELIWNRFVASQMSPAVWKVTEGDIVAEIPPERGGGEATLKTIGRTLEFDGFLRVVGRPGNGEQILPALTEGKQVAAVELAPTQHFTQAPPRYTEASLVKTLEAEGIGRPSTYAAIIQTIQDRGYVEQHQRAFAATDLGIVVTDKLVKHFPKVLDVRFTAHMEDQLDRVEEAQLEGLSVLEEFYGPFSENLRKASENMVHAKAEEHPSDYTCEKCSKPMVYKFSKNGRYLACTGYPECKTTHPVDKEGKKVERVPMDIACPKCTSPMLLRKGRFGPFLSCLRYPECDGIVNLDKKGFVKFPSAPPLQVDLPCSKCSAPLNLRR